MGAIAAAAQFRDRLRIRLNEARARTDDLFRIVRPEAFYDRPIRERHRMVFYLGHLEAFDWNLLCDALELRSFHPGFDRLFAFGIDPLGGGGLPTDQPTDWPARPEIERYNRRVRGTIDASLARVPFDDPNRPLLHDGLLLEAAIEHRLMHAETLAYMLHQLSLDRKFARPVAPAPSVPPTEPRMVEIPGGQVTLGLPRTSSGPFGWDNEFEQHGVEVPAFAIDAHNVTNGEYLQFVRESGYEHCAFWKEADWQWKETLGVRHPRFWVSLAN